MNRLSITNKVIGLFFIIGCLSFSPAKAQKLTVSKTVVNVGKTAYEVPISGTFELRNKSTKPLVINDVKADCGCTKVDWPTKKIGPNERFTISVTYDARMLGHFTKQVAVYSNATKDPVYLQIKGVVQEEYIDVGKNYPFDMDGLKSDVNNLEFDDVKKGDQREATINIYNDTEHAMTPNMMHLPDYLSAIAFPEILPPGRTGKMTVTLHSDKVKNFGLTQTPVYLAHNLGDKVNAKIEIPVSVILLPDMTSFNGDNRQHAPIMELSADSLDIGMHNGKMLKSGLITITNTGHSELTISSLQMFTKGLSVTLDKQQLHPGEQAKLKVKGNRDQLLKARSKPRILMITNDPEHAKVVIKINVK